MNTLTQCTVTRAEMRANAHGAHAACTYAHATYGGAPWAVRVATAHALSTIASDKGLARALHRTRQTANRWRLHASTPLAETAEAVYLIARRGLNAKPVIDAIRAAAELGAREHARRYGGGRMA